MLLGALLATRTLLVARTLLAALLRTARLLAARLLTALRRAAGSLPARLLAGRRRRDLAGRGLAGLVRAALLGTALLVRLAGTTLLTRALLAAAALRARATGPGRRRLLGERGGRVVLAALTAGRRVVVIVVERRRPGAGLLLCGLRRRATGLLAFAGPVRLLALAAAPGLLPGSATLPRGTTLTGTTLPGRRTGRTPRLLAGALLALPRGRALRRALLPGRRATGRRLLLVRVLRTGCRRTAGRRPLRALPLLPGRRGRAPVFGGTGVATFGLPGVAATSRVVTLVVHELASRTGVVRRQVMHSRRGSPAARGAVLPAVTT